MKRILPLIVVAQFCCTTLWFAGNGVMNGLVEEFQLPGAALGYLTSAVQLGFIAGTLLFALLALPDRISPSRLFFLSAVGGAICNALLVPFDHSLYSLIFLRFGVGFFLAGIYPVGMKIAADHFDTRLGRSLGYLVGALVLGTAFPHLLRDLLTEFPWTYVLLGTSLLAFTGGILLLLFVPDGPHRRAGRAIRLGEAATIFRNKNFRTAALGYFGHMWELYAFWAFVPVLLTAYGAERLPCSVSVGSFLIIAAGSLGCVVGGNVSSRSGTARVARWALTLSGFCCLLVGVFFKFPPLLFFSFLVFWGFMVVADSPLFSTLVARNAPPTATGTALTLVNCLGFTTTIFSIQLLAWLWTATVSPWVFLILLPGPLIGVRQLWSNRVPDQPIR